MTTRSCTASRKRLTSKGYRRAAASPLPFASVLSATAVSRFHGTAVVLDEVSLSVAPGSRIGVVGPNGIGKSTLLRILAGVEQPDAGRVERAPASLTVG